MTSKATEIQNITAGIPEPIKGFRVIEKNGFYYSQYRLFWLFWCELPDYQHLYGDLERAIQACEAQRDRWIAGENKSIVWGGK